MYHFILHYMYFKIIIQKKKSLILRLDISKDKDITL